MGGLGGWSGWARGGGCKSSGEVKTFRRDEEEGKGANRRRVGRWRSLSAEAPREGRAPGAGAQRRRRRGAEKWENGGAVSGGGRE